MDEFLHKYTAGELLDWFQNRPIEDYLDHIIEENNGESYALTVLDIEAIKKDFAREIRRYEVVKRGYTLFIFDNKTCQDLFSFRYTDINYEDIQNTASSICASLNNREMNFIGSKEKCW